MRQGKRQELRQMIENEARREVMSKDSTRKTRTKQTGIKGDERRKKEVKSRVGEKKQ